MSNKERGTEKTFTSTEVGTLIESLRADFRAVAEVVAPIPERLSAVENRLEKVEIRLTSVEDVVRIAIPSLSARVSVLETKAGV
jgi:BMFP domain-containing protein YqiC